MNKVALKILIGLIALSLAVCAAFFSVVGLSKLFAGAALAVVIMASTLEASKLVIASFLYQYWTSISKTLRAYLVTAVVIIASITSIGIYGFLSGAYQTTKSTYDLTQTTVDSLTTKKLYYESSVVSYRDQLVLLTDERKSIDQSVSELSKGLSNNVITYTDANGNLIDINERTKIFKNEDGVIVYEDNDQLFPLTADTTVSMNFLCYPSSFVSLCESEFSRFLDTQGMELKSEFFLPSVTKHFVNAKLGNVKVGTTSASWFGVTYKEDAPVVQACISDLVEKGLYPSNLWGS